jgi:DNA polymerase III epsilon subunit-like protein
MTTPSWIHKQPPWIHVLDTETTGLPSDPTTHVVEIAVVSLRTAHRGSIEIESTWDTLINPGVPLTDQHLEICQRISSITQADIERGRTPAFARERLIRRLAIRPGPIVAWNLPFDRRMVRRTLYGIDEARYHNFDNDDKYGAPQRLVVPSDPLPWGGCLAHHYLGVKGPVNGHYDAGGGVPKPRMPPLKQALQLEDVKRWGAVHRALSDTLATSEIVMKLWRGEVERWEPGGKAGDS